MCLRCTYYAVCVTKMVKLASNSTFLNRGLGTVRVVVPCEAQNIRPHAEPCTNHPVPVVVFLGWTWLQTSSPPGALLCVIWVQVVVWFQGCSPTCWQARGAPALEAPAYLQTPRRLIQPPRRSWRRITMAARSTRVSINRSTDTRETPTVSQADGVLQSGIMLRICFQGIFANLIYQI